MKNKLKNFAINLRMKGYSFREISEKLDISKSTASLWTRHVQLNSLARMRLKRVSLKGIKNSNKTQRDRKKKRLEDAITEADLYFNKFRDSREIKLALLAMIYSCEGVKFDGTLAFINSDKNLVRMFLKLLREVFNIDEDKLRVCIHLHDYHSENKLRKFWSKITNISENNFIKSYVKYSNHIYKKRDYNGCVRITYHDAHTARVILSFAKSIMRHYS